MADDDNPEFTDLFGTPADASRLADEPEAETATLVYEGPFYVASYQIEDKDGGTLVFDRNGTDVPAEDADQYVADAAANGVNLTRKAN